GVPSASGVAVEHVRVVSSHALVPWHGSESVQFRVASLETQLNLQSLSQPSPATRLPSSHSSPASSALLPQPRLVHTPPWQTRSGCVGVPQETPSGTGVPGRHVLVLSSHTAPNAQGFAQLRVGSVDTHVFWQFVSQPSPAVRLPSSHSSGGLTNRPSPQTIGVSTHAPSMQLLFWPHAVPFGTGVPGPQVPFGRQTS